MFILLNSIYNRLVVKENIIYFGEDRRLCMKILSKLIALVLLISVILFSFQFALNKAFATSKGSTIGSVNVEDLSDKEMEKKLNEAIKEWMNSDLYITIGGHNVQVSGDDFLFDVNASIKQYKNDTDKSWYAFWQQNPTVHEQLEVVANDSLIKKIQNETNLKVEEVKPQILEAASYLKESPIKLNVQDIAINDAERISFETISIKDSAISDVTEIAKQLDGIMIEPETPFSFNDVAEKAGGNDDEMTLVASVLYSAVLQSSFEILERHQADTIPKIVKPGYEATVSPFLEKDLKFVSHSTVPAKIVAKVKNGVLKVELYSLPGIPEVTIVEKNRMTVEPRTIYRYSNNLEIGQSHRVQEPKAGLQLLIYRTITDENGDSKSQLISQNYYAPENEIIEKSSKQPEVDTSSTTNTTNANNTNSSDAQGTSSNTSQNNTNSADLINQKTESNNDTSKTKPNEATKSKNGGDVPKGSYYNKTGDIVTPKDTK